MEDTLLKQARALYKDRIRIVLSTLLIIFAVTFYIFYSPNVLGLRPDPPNTLPGGWIQGLEVVTSFNTIGFLIALALMVLTFRFWSWAFLPGPASTYTLSILEGILGPKTSVKQLIGKRFRITLDNGLQFDVACLIKEKGTDEWFTYRLSSKIVQGNDVDDFRKIALRHGLSFKNHRFVTSVSSDELLNRTFLFTKALLIANFPL
ncbi:MAG: hypothetical protein JW779_15305 [Candidatus Thorarchaeota archaeon]|nr:hypothetical protein [Candidatus Thorarchaeota archaeon]